jgi:hypothetical protein
LSSVTNHASQEQVGVLIFIITAIAPVVASAATATTTTTTTTATIHGPVHHFWLSYSQNYFHSYLTEFTVLFVTFSSIFTSCLHCLSAPCLLPKWFPSGADVAHSHCLFICHSHNALIMLSEYYSIYFSYCLIFSWAYITV